MKHLKTFLTLPFAHERDDVTDHVGLQRAQSPDTSPLLVVIGTSPRTLRDLVIEFDDHGKCVFAEQSSAYHSRRSALRYARELERYLIANDAVITDLTSDVPRRRTVMNFDRLIASRTWVRDDITILQILIGQYETVDPRSPDFQVSISLHRGPAEQEPRHVDISSTTGPGWAAFDEQPDEPSTENVLISICEVIAADEESFERTSG